MSYRLMDVTLRRSRSRGTTKLVLVTLASYVNEKERLKSGEATCFPGIATVGKLTGVSRSQVKRSLRELRELGEVTWEQRGYHRSNLYTLTLPLDDGTNETAGDEGPE